MCVVSSHQVCGNSATGNNISSLGTAHLKPLCMYCRIKQRNIYTGVIENQDFLWLKKGIQNMR